MSVAQVELARKALKLKQENEQKKRKAVVREQRTMRAADVPQRELGGHHRRHGDRGDGDGDGGNDSEPDVLVPAFMIGYRSELEQAKLLDVTTRTLRGWRKKREGPAWTKKGKQYLYHDDWTADWLQQNKVQPVRSRRRRQRTADHASAA
jgi:hypothetical protein